VGAGQLFVLRVLVRMKIAGTPGSGSSWKNCTASREHKVQRFEVWVQGSVLKCGNQHV
jgi:hypothetical protein